MLSVHKADPLFINFVPKTAVEAVDRYQRCKRRGLKAYLIPECLITCAQGLPADELEKFEQWIINPEGYVHDRMELVETKQLQADNAAIFAANVERIEQQLYLDEEPPLPRPTIQEALLRLDQDDEKMQDVSDDEKMQDVSLSPLSLQQPAQEDPPRFIIESD